MPPLIRRARAEDAARIAAIARAAYLKYVPRVGREPAPMMADFAAEIAADRVVVIGTAGAVDGYMIAWPENDSYFIDNIAVDPLQQGKGLGRQLVDRAVDEAKRHICRRSASIRTRQ
jgi:GNAT superfamily N-acetyltransferase